MSSRDSNTYNRQAWESSDFPIICETCLGPNPYIRMTKEKYGKECKICTRPFTVFSWQPGSGQRVKTTQICQTCCKIKNVCQTCVFDLDFGLPTQVRDTVLGITDIVPTSDVNKQYYAQNMDKQLSLTDGTVPVVGKMKVTDAILKLARTDPYYKRNRAHLCSFWVKGECKRGEECPYRHEMPSDPNDPLSKQNIKDRYYGVNDPVAEKIMKRAKANGSIGEAPEDKSITTLYIGGVTPEITEQDLRDHFYQFGEIRSVTVVQRQSSAFVEFTSRAAAEAAMHKAQNHLGIKGQTLRAMWGRARAAGLSTPDASAALPVVPAVPGLPGAVPLPPQIIGVPGVNAVPPPPPPLSLPPGMAPAFAPQIYYPPPPVPQSQPQRGPPTAFYPSMDPYRMGTGKGPKPQ